MLEFREITIEDREIMQEYLRIDNAYMTERCFASLFLWSENYKIKVAFHNDVMYVCNCTDKDEYLAFAPLAKGNFKDAVMFALNCSREQNKGIKFIAVSKKQRQEFEDVFASGDFEFIENRNAMDYIYKSEDLMWLLGKNYSSKRNHINRFKSEREGMWIYEELDFVKHYDEILDFQVEWSKKKGAEDLQNLAETIAIKKALKYYKELDLRGGVVRLNGKMIAFTMGVKVNDSLFDIFFEKALPGINGAYPLINQLFAQNNLKEIPFVNREEDMGIEGMRTAKLSYAPYELTMKYIAVPNMENIYKL